MQLIGTGHQRAAKTSRIVVTGTPLAYASWNNEVTGEDAGTVNFESYNAAAGQTYDEGVLGPLKCASRLGGDWDAGNNPFGTPPGLYPRDDLTNQLLYTSRLDVVLWTFPFFRIRTSTNGAENMNGKVTFTWAGFNQGPFTFPSGNA